jgi:hypothetical protein
MGFKTAAQRACYDKIAPWVRELFGEAAVVRDDLPLVDITVGSAHAQVGVFPRGDDETVIVTRAYLVAGAWLDQDLMEFLLHRNAERERFGAFGIDADGQILFQHAIVGSTCDRQELQASVAAVVHAADEFDDEIVKRWGGSRVGSAGT